MAQATSVVWKSGHGAETVIENGNVPDYRGFSTDPSAMEGYGYGDEPGGPYDGELRRVCQHASGEANSNRGVSSTQPIGVGDWASATTDEVRSPPRCVLILTALAAIGGFLFGYDTGVISTATMQLRKDLSPL